MYCRRKSVSDRFPTQIYLQNQMFFHQYCGVSEFLYHGLVDMSPSLELDDSIAICGECLGVFEGAPSLSRLDLQLNQWGFLLFGPSCDDAVLCHQLTTTAPEQQKHNKYVLYLIQREMMERDVVVNVVEKNQKFLSTSMRISTAFGSILKYNYTLLKKN